FFDADRGERAVADVLGETADEQVGAVKQAPDHEGPVGAVPESADAERNDQRETPAGGRTEARDERVVKIIAEPTRQRDVPALPEFGNGFGIIRRPEIFHEIE